jgi:hypothetical protein
MPTEVRIGLLVVGAVFVLAALATLALRVPRTLRVLLGLFGVGLLAWGVTLQLLSPAGPTSSSLVNPPAATSGAGATSSAAKPRADLTLVASSAFTDCAKPADPAAPPDGTSASKAQMLAAQQTLKAYDAGVTAYTRCVDAATERIVVHYQGYVPVSELDSVKALGAKVHNAAVDQDTVLVGRFNQQLHIFLAKQRPYQNPLPAAP